MRTKRAFNIIALFLMPAVVCLPALAQPTSFTYQGRLNEGTNPVSGLYDLRFALYDDALAGSALGSPLTNNAVAVSNGLFTTTLDFGQGPFNGTPLWLQISARSGGGGAFTLLSPRQQLTPSPFALRAANAGTVFGSGILGTIGDASLSVNIARLNGASQVFSGALTLTNPANVFAGSGAGLTNLNVTGLNVWGLTGNAGTTPGSQFLGTTDNRPLEFRVNGSRALRVQPDPRGLNAPNLVGGFYGNSIGTNGAGSSVIAGGGWSGGPNMIQDNSSGDFIGAGSANVIRSNANDSVIAGGYGNNINAHDAVIGGGISNEASATGSSILGGVSNTNSGSGAVIAGGNGNNITSSGADGAIGGGAGNHVNARGATVPGGYLNTAAGEQSLAAGFRAQANHNGAFVWADSTGADFYSTGPNQFNVRARGGARFETGGAAFTVDGPITASRFQGDGSGLTNVPLTGNITIAPPATLSFGDGTRQMLNLWNTNCGIGVQPGTLYFRANNTSPDDGFAWYKGGSHSDLWNAPGSGGTRLMRLDSGGLVVNTLTTLSGDTFISGGATIRSGGGFGSPQLLLQQTNPADWSRMRFQSSGPAWDIALGPGAQPVLNFYDGTSAILALSSTNVALNKTVQFPLALEPKINLWSDRYVIGMQENAMYFRCDGDKVWNSFIWYQGGVHNSGFTNTGGGLELMRLNAYGLFVKTEFLAYSDRNAKTNFAPVNPREVLDKVAALPISTWNFKDGPTTPHLGPMAQDFHAAFGVGPDDKHIATVDADGVALAAIQGLNEKVESGKQKTERRMTELEDRGQKSEIRGQRSEVGIRKLEAKLQRQETEIGELKKRLEQLESVLTHQTGGAQ